MKPYELTVDQRLDPGAWLRRMDERGCALSYEEVAAAVGSTRWAPLLDE